MSSSFLSRKEFSGKLWFRVRVRIRVAPGGSSFRIREGGWVEIALRGSFRLRSTLSFNLYDIFVEVRLDFGLWGPIYSDQ